jgi:hypothetical protein
MLKVWWKDCAIPVHFPNAHIVAVKGEILLCRHVAPELFDVVAVDFSGFLPGYNRMEQ